MKVTQGRLEYLVDTWYPPRLEKVHLAFTHRSQLHGLHLAAEVEASTVREVLHACKY